MVGPVVLRDVIRPEPVACAPREQLVASAPCAQLVATIGPAVQRYLTGDLSHVFGPQEIGETKLRS